jgi:LAS superfamily LD-carboxypeptidase LdcB
MTNDLMCALGLINTHITESGGALMNEQAADAFSALQARASAAGFQLSVVSSFRSYERQLAIFNGKWRGERPVLDDFDRALIRQDYSEEQWLHRILRFSALPGTSRHHWGTDIDIFDPTRIPVGESLQLIPSEYRNGGIFEDLTQWLDERIAADDCEGFFRPYDRDRGGVSEEPWHLSYEPVASALRPLVTAGNLRDLWLREPGLRPDGYESILPLLNELMDRYVV